MAVKPSRVALVAASLAVLAACASTATLRQGRELAAKGDLPGALALVDQGIAQSPDDVELLTLRVSLREELANRTLAAANAERTAGRPDAAEAILRKLLAIEPANERAKSLLLELDRDRRTRLSEQEAIKMVQAGQQQRALLVVENALKDDPRNAQLLRLQRDIEFNVKREEDANAGRLVQSAPISLEFRDANLRMVLEALSRATGVNFVVDKDVRADLQTTIFLKQARLEDALNLLTTSSQLSMQVLNPTTVMIFANTAEKAREYRDLLIRGFYLTNADARQTGNLLRTMLKLRDVFVDEKLNLVVVRDTPDAVRLAERLVAMHDLSEPEVMLEVEVLEVKATRLLELGIKYPDSFSLTPLPPSGSTSLTLDDLRNLNSSRIGVSTPSLTLNFKREVGDLNVLANPKIRARNREKARILIGDRVPVITSTATSTGFVSESVQYIEVGIKLEVEPNVYFDDDVAIKVALEVSNLAREIRTSSGTLAYQIGTRSASTTLRLRDGETQLLAGLLSNAERSDGARIPGLGDLPVLNRIFGSQRDSAEKTEIVLSITPRLIRPARMPDANLNEFWSGTEATLRLRPLKLAASDVKPVPGMTDAATPASVVTARAASAAVAMLAPVSGATQKPPSLAVLAFESPTRAKVGDEIAISLRLKADGGIRSLPLQIKFDPQQLEVLDVSEGEFFQQASGKSSFTQQIVASEGRVQVMAQRAGADGAFGDHVVLTLRVKPLTAGTTTLEVVSASALGVEGVDPPTTLPAPVTIAIE